MSVLAWRRMSNSPLQEVADLRLLQHPGLPAGPNSLQIHSAGLLRVRMCGPVGGRARPRHRCFISSAARVL